MVEHIKVGYQTLRGGMSKAYLEDDGGVVLIGSDKHTGELVAVRWDGSQWVEVMSSDA